MRPIDALKCLAVTVAALVASAGLGSAASTLDNAKSAGYIRVGFPNQVPYAYADDKGQLTGVDADIARRVVKHMGIAEMDGVLTEFSSLIPGLKAGRFDMVLAMFVNPTRCAEVAFSEPAYSVGQALLVAKDNPKKIAGYDDLVKGDAKIAVMSGAVQANYLKTLGVAEGRIQSYPDMTGSVAAVTSGRADVFAISALAARRLIATDGGTSVSLVEGFSDPVVNGKPARGYDAFAVRKGDTELLAAFNKALAEVMAEPDFESVIKPYGLTKKDLPDKKTAELCR
ncbi:ectoine/hydroxyectoine ABC transporter substrate-binding protein EhuB [Labrys okinawensis]|uniref:ectoine/hydroxyectoine ABC transporter substrate-binding protein EhuB n=1 Tax=Labrys okinawensis TaxID=346911 RepID=UPI0039BCD77A